METKQQATRVYGVVTRFIGPSNTKGARIAVRDDNGRRGFYPYAYEASQGVGAHGVAVAQFLAHKGGMSPADAARAVFDAYAVSTVTGYTFALPRVGFQHARITTAGVVRNRMVLTGGVAP